MVLGSAWSGAICSAPPFTVPWAIFVWPWPSVFGPANELACCGVEGVAGVGVGGFADSASEVGVGATLAPVEGFLGGR